MSEQMKIFISHDVENDGHIATTLKDKLTLLSANKVKAEVCSEDILGGQLWRQWMVEKVTNADLFIYLYSNDQHNKYWLNLELGLFLGSHNDKQGPICIMNDYLRAPPKVLAEYQHYSADEEGFEKFFKDLLIRGAFSDDGPINECIQDSTYVTAMEEAVTDLASLFSRNKIEVDVFENRITVQLGDKGTAVNDLDDAIIIIDDNTSSYLEVSRNTDSWGSLKSQFQERGTGWVDELEGLVRKIRDGVAPDKHMSLTPFNLRDNEVCYPVISRIKRRTDIPISLTILFVSSEPERKNFREIKAPDDLSILVSLLTVTRRFRWNVIEPALQDLRKKEQLELDHTGLLRNLWDAVTKLEAEAEQLGFLSEARVRRIFTADRQQLIMELFGRWYELKKDLRRSVERELLTETIEVLKELRAVNKKSLIAIVDEYRDRIETMAPLEQQKDPQLYSIR